MVLKICAVARVVLKMSAVVRMVLQMCAVAMMVLEMCAMARMVHNKSAVAGKVLKVQAQWLKFTVNILNLSERILLELLSFSPQDTGHGAVRRP